jgi:methyl-accepting chemotaxis protein
MSERRTNPRVDVQLAGQLLLPRGIVLACRIRDLSRGGAQIVFEKAEKLPERFGVRIGASPTVRGVAVTWRRPGELGVRFVDA